jgi:hypothetical protein
MQSPPLHCRPRARKCQRASKLSREFREGQPVTRMYTQWEYGRTYLYIEHGREQLTTVDVTKKQHPKVVNHEPAQVQPTL